MESVTDVGSHAGLTTALANVDRGEVLAGRYQIETLIGTGGSGRVFRAYDRITRSAVALKILKPEFAADPVWVDRFSRELRLGRQLLHPNVCRVFDIGEADGHRFLTMELATGGSIRSQLGRAGGGSGRKTGDTTSTTGDKACELRPLAERIDDASAIVEGLAAIHGIGIVHRDIKPDNILRMDDGRLIITDFGLATDLGNQGNTIMVGTPAYMAPEVVMGDPATLRSDVWGLGVVLHEVVFGGRPEWGTMVRGRRHFSLPATPTPVERRIAELCGRCVDDDAQLRPPSAVEVLAEFRRALAGRRLSVRVRRAPFVWGAVAAACAGLLFGFGGRFWHSASASSADLAYRQVNLSAALDGVKDTPMTTDSRLLATYEGDADCLWSSPDGKRLRVSNEGGTRVEDIDLTTGARAPWEMAPSESDGKGCPRWSAHGRRVLIESDDPAGVAHIAIADEHGRNGHVLVAGRSPVWVGADEFAFDIDLGNAAIFAVSTREIRLVPDPAPGIAKDVARKSWDPVQGRLTVQYLTEKGERLAATYLSPRMGLERLFHLPPVVVEMIGAPTGGFFFTSMDTGGDYLVMFGEDAKARGWFHVPSLNVNALRPLGSRTVAVSASAVSTQLFVEEPWVPARVVAVLPQWAGFPALGRNDDLYVEAWVGPWTNIMRVDPTTGRFVTVTHGKADMLPTGAADGGFLYTDMGRQVLRRCDANGGRCKDLVHNPGVPVLGVESPDGARIAYVTLQGNSRLWVSDVANGETSRDLGPARAECSPVWEDDRHVWFLRGTEDQATWALTDVTRPDRTDLRSVAVPRGAVSGGCETAPPGAEVRFPVALRTSRAEVRTIRLP